MSQISFSFSASFLLVLVNLIVFACLLLVGLPISQVSVDELVHFGANTHQYTVQQGEWWRLFTSSFTHSGIVHFCINIIALASITFELEPNIGKTRILTVYILSIILASTALVWWDDFQLSTGVSYAVVGLIGVLLVLVTVLNKRIQNRILLILSLGSFTLYYVILNAWAADTSHIVGHLAALISGIALGFTFIPGLIQNDNTQLKYGTIAGLFILCIVTCGLIYRTLPYDLANYNRLMKEFAAMESMAMEVFTLPDGAPKEKILYGLKDRGLYYWAENQKLVDQIAQLDLPLSMKKENTLRKKYCNLRLESFDLMSKAIIEDTEKYKEEIAALNGSIAKLLEQHSN